jgi:adenylate cyclase
MASKLSFFWAELKRRKVIRVAVVYAVVGIGFIEAADLILPQLLLPEWTVRLVVVLILLGFPVALSLAWALEVFPDSSHSFPPKEMQSTDSAVPAATEEVGTLPEADSNHESIPTPPGAGRSVAVLPFESMSSEPGGDYFEDGITEELTNALAKQPGLRVAARTSAFAFKGERVDVREIGARLNVSHVIEGSVRRSGQTLRITAQLINTADGYHIWSQQFDRKLGDVFRIQEEIAANVVEGIRDGIPAETRPEVPTTKLSAYEAFLRGRYALATFGPKSLARAIEEFETCIDIDDSYAPAFASLADALTNQAIGFSDHPPRDSMARARGAATRALELDPRLPEGHLAWALVRMWHDFDFEGAKAGFDRALEINPNFADAHLWLEFYWTYIRFDFGEALAANRRAQQLSPLDSRANLRLATLQMVFGYLEEAERLHRQELAGNPGAPVSHLGLGDTLFRRGEGDEAIFHVGEAIRLAGRPTLWLGMLGAFYGAQGKESESRAVLAEMEERAAEGYVSGFWMGVAHAGLGQFDEAFSCLGRGVEERDSNLLYLFAVPRALGLHDHPEFPRILDQIGLGHLVEFI